MTHVCFSIFLPANHPPLENFFSNFHVQLLPPLQHKNLFLSFLISLPVRIRPYLPTFSIQIFFFSLLSTTMTDASSSIVVPTPHATITNVAITIDNSITHELSKDNYRLWKATMCPFSKATLSMASLMALSNLHLKPLKLCPPLMELKLSKRKAILSMHMEPAGSTNPGCYYILLNRVHHHLRAQVYNFL